MDACAAASQGEMPRTALLTRRCSEGYSFDKALVICDTEATLERSTTGARTTFPPPLSLEISETSFCPRPSSLQVRSVLYPALAISTAIARPICPVAPVTSATFAMLLLFSSMLAEHSRLDAEKPFGWVVSARVNGRARASNRNKHPRINWGPSFQSLPSFLDTSKTRRRQRMMLRLFDTKNQARGGKSP